MAGITEKTTLAEVLKNPKSQEVLLKHRVPCLTCPFAHMEMEKLKLSDVCQTYNLDLKALLKELNQL